MVRERRRRAGGDGVAALRQAPRAADLRTAPRTAIVRGAGARLLGAGILAVSVLLPGAARSLPGLQGTQGDDLTLVDLYGTRNFEALPGWPVLYVSSEDNAADCSGNGTGGHAGQATPYGECLPVGDDANPGTLALPVRTLAKVEQVLDERPDDDIHRIVSLDPYDTWVDFQDHWGGADRIVVTYRCGTGASGSFDPDEPCFFLLGSTNPHPARKAVLDCRNFQLAYQGLFQLLNPAGSSGWAGVANVETRNCPPNPADNTSVWLSTGNAIYVNVHAGDLQGIEAHAFKGGDNGDPNHQLLLATSAHYLDTSLYDSDCSGKGCGGPLGRVLCNGPGTPYACCEADSGAFRCGVEAHVYEYGESHITLISDKVQRIDAWQNGSSGSGAFTHFLTEPHEHPLSYTLIGPRFRGPFRSHARIGSPGTEVRGNAFHFHPDDSAGGVSRADVARVSVEGIFDNASRSGELHSNGGHVRRATGVGSRFDFRIYQSTFSQMHSALTFWAAAPDTVTATGRCNLFDELAVRDGEANVVTVGEPNEPGAVVLDFDGTNIHDNEDNGAATVFQLDGNDYAMASAVPAQIDDPGGEPVEVTVAPDFFGDDANELGPGDQNVFWGTHPGLADVCSPYTIELAVPVPAFVKGVRIDSLKLATHFTQAGARDPRAVSLGPSTVVCLALGLGAAAAVWGRRRRPLPTR